MSTHAFAATSAGGFLAALGVLAIAIPLLGARDAGAPGGTAPGAEAMPSALRQQLSAALAKRPADYVPRTRHLAADGSPLYTNRLFLEASPYLRQHAHNPVDWHPWGEEAFEKARRLGRPVLVSIGYSTCHWCHVMEDESFDDVETARVLNAKFIAIKVDREARPDVDAVYMAAIHAMGQRGGWPLNVFVTPERKPFYAGTYFPPQEAPGRPSFVRILNTVAEQWQQQPDDIREGADALADAVRAGLEIPAARESRVLDPQLRAQAIEQVMARSDTTWGGVGNGTKFPSSLPLRFAIREERRSKHKALRRQILLTLDQMATGGIRDHIGGGFHRYATDPRWMVPHFEKMLYDNAQLARVYTTAWQWSGEERYAVVARDTLAYLDREMSSPEGGFYSATDADSRAPSGEMEEGWYFTWTPAELDAALGADAARIAAAWWGITPSGNFEWRSIPHTRRSESEVAKKLGLTVPALRRALEPARETLRRAREGRPAPLRDDKQLVAWNALAISAFARAGFAFTDTALVARAQRAARFVLSSMRAPSSDGTPGRLRRVYLDGHADGPAFLSDYALLIDALIDLYEADADPAWLHEAIALQRDLDAHYADTVGGGYYRTANDAERLLAREKPASDGVLPSGNSAAASALLRLFELTGDSAYQASATALVSALAESVARSPSAFAELWLALELQQAPREVVLVSPESGGAAAREAMLAPLRRSLVDAHVLVVTSEGAAQSEIAATVPLVAGKRAIGGRVTAYVCENRVCSLPTKDPQMFAHQLGLTAD